MISLIIFGLVLPQPLQALFIFISPIKEFFSNHKISLCIIVGLIQGICEEGGYYLIFRYKLKQYNSRQLPILFGIGRSGLELLYNIIFIFTIGTSFSSLIIILIARIFGFGGTIGLSILDYAATQPKKKYLLYISIILHAVMNSVLYAMELGLLPSEINIESYFMILFSIVIMLISLFIYIKFNGNKVKV